MIAACYFWQLSVSGKMKIFLSLVLILNCLISQAQKKEPTQISGILITNDSIPQHVPFAHVVVKHRQRGTMSNAEGFFSFAALPNDTIYFTSIGFKKEMLIVPDTLNQKEYLARIVMKRDTTILQEVTLYPWPTPDRFKEVFLAIRIPTTDEDRAMRNLAIQELRETARKMGYSSEEIQDFAIISRQSQIYNYGRYQGFNNGGTAILGNLTNPFAWAEFFNSIKRGDFDSN